MDFDAIFNANPTIAVIGDLMLDEWISGEATRISPEAPVPVVRFDGRKTAPGGAANVVANLRSLGANVSVAGVVGRDEAALDLKNALEGQGAGLALIVDDSRPTTLKTRVVAQRQQLVRIDRESDAPFSGDVQKRLESAISGLLDGGVKAVCLSDYDKGMARGGAFQDAIRAAKERGLIVTGGPKPANLGAFIGADLLSLNWKEARESTGTRLDTIEEIEIEGEALRERLELRALVITRGGAGATVFRSGHSPRHISAHAVEVFDVAGAGDTFLAAATLALATGADFLDAARLGNLAAAASVRHVGVVAISPAEIRALANES